jgi:hypothetical protein
VTDVEYAEMLDWIDDRWGRVPSWANATSLYADFAELDAVECWAALHARMSGDPDKAKWPPSPPELRALTLDRMRHHESPPGLPETTETWNWAVFSQHTYGEVLPIAEAIRRRSEELAS